MGIKSLIYKVSCDACGKLLGEEFKSIELALDAIRKHEWEYNVNIYRESSTYCKDCFIGFKQK